MEGVVVDLLLTNGGIGLLDKLHMHVCVTSKCGTRRRIEREGCM